MLRQDLGLLRIKMIGEGNLLGFGCSKESVCVLQRLRAG